MKTKHVIFSKNDQNKIKVTPALRALVRRAVKAALEYENFNTPAEVSVTFTDNEGIRALNSEYRDIDRETDVLSFPFLDGGRFDTEGENGTVLLGDIVISLEKADAQAKEYGHSFERETAFLTVHSVLHLLGYDHETSKEDELDMFTRQDEIMKKLGLSRDSAPEPARELY